MLLIWSVDNVVSLSLLVSLSFHNFSYCQDTKKNYFLTANGKLRLYGSINLPEYTIFMGNKQTVQFFIKKGIVPKGPQWEEKTEETILRWLDWFNSTVYSGDSTAIQKKW